MTHYAELEIDVDAPDLESDPRFEGLLSFEAEVVYTHGTPRWSGSLSTCPSDIDWYGEPPAIEGWESVRVWDLITDGYRDATASERARLDAWAATDDGQRFMAGEAERLAEQDAQRYEDGQAEHRADLREEAGWL